MCQELGRCFSRDPTDCDGSAAAAAAAAAAALACLTYLLAMPSSASHTTSRVMGETQVALRDDQMLLQRQLHLRQPPGLSGSNCRRSRGGGGGGRGEDWPVWNRTVGVTAV